MSNSSNPLTYAEVAVSVLSSYRKRGLTAAEVFESARKMGLLRRFTSQGRTLKQVRVGLSAKLRQSASAVNSRITANQKNGVNYYSV